MPIIGRPIMPLSLNRLFYLIKGLDQYTAVTGGFSALAMRRASGNTARAPTIDATTGPYITVTQTKSSSTAYTGAYAAANLVDLTSKSKIVLIYDITTDGTASQYRLLKVCLFANSSKVYASNYQKSSTYNTETDGVQAGVTLTNQVLELNISGSTGTLDVGIGLNQSNPQIGGTLTIKALYAE